MTTNSLLLNFEDLFSNCIIICHRKQMHLAYFICTYSYGYRPRFPSVITQKLSHIKRKKKKANTTERKHRSQISDPQHLFSCQRTKQAAKPDDVQPAQGQTFTALSEPEGSSAFRRSGGAWRDVHTLEDDLRSDDNVRPSKRPRGDRCMWTCRADKDFSIATARCLHGNCLITALKKKEEKKRQPKHKQTRARRNTQIRCW